MTIVPGFDQHTFDFHLRAKRIGDINVEAFERTIGGLFAKRWIGALDAYTQLLVSSVLQA